MAKPSAVFGILNITILASFSFAADLDPTQSILPPSMASLSGSQEQLIANIFTSCTGGINQSIAQTGQALQQAILGGKAGAFVSMGTDCNILPGSGIASGARAPDASNLKCETFMQGNVFNPEAYNKMFARLQASDQINICRKNKMQAAQGELKCLSDQAQILDAQMSQLQEAYTQAIQRNQSAVQQLKSIEEDRKAQQADVRKRLGGEENGKPGLRELLKNSLGMLGGMDTEVATVEKLVSDGKVARGKYAELVQQKASAEAQNCFTQKTSAQFLCDALRPNENRPQEASVPGCAKGSACDYLMCRYWENQHLVAGKLDKSQKAKDDAKNAAKYLSGIFSSILNELPKSAKSTSDYVMNMREFTPTIKNASDVEKAFGGQLAGLNGRGFDIRGNTVQLLTSCFKDANRRVNTEKENKSSALYEARKLVDDGDKAIQATINNTLSRYQSQWQDNMAGLTGLNLPLDVSRCRSASGTPDVQVGCLKQFRTNMEALISGTPANGVPVGGIQMQIRGTKAENTISFTCQGLKGCVTALENTDRNLGEEVRRVGDFKANYVLQANNSIDAFTKRIAAMLGPQMRDLDARLKAINTSLGSLGARGPNIAIKKGRNFSKDPETGLYVMDGAGGRGGSVTVQDVIASSQPFLDVQGENFSESLTTIGEAIAKIDEDQGRTSDALAVMQGMEVSCRTKFADAQLTTAMTAASSLSNCVLNKGYNECNTYRKTRVSQLIMDWNGVSGGDIGYQGGAQVANILDGIVCGEEGSASSPTRQNCDSFVNSLVNAKVQMGRALEKNPSALDATGMSR